ncbi:hypothetical protein D7S91_18555 [Burkholderia contaminans]|nr:hypothetical protein [Burkholderia contaminans]MBA9863765.1 hypothetical protein [Burkholderia contaminans]MBA9906448.1 hypothetical protein [Burkholderia contaminans]QDS24900.1 hypothetical protein FPQ37_00755 [Burkholderia contaminans]RDS99552.1 hypothetical protein DWU95_34760 [Burkholderia contaminans]
MRHGLPSPWVAGRTAYAGWTAAGAPAAEKCRNAQGGRACTAVSAERPACACIPNAEELDATNAWSARLPWA